MKRLIGINARDGQPDGKPWIELTWRDDATATDTVETLRYETWEEWVAALATYRQLYLDSTAAPPSPDH